MMAVDVMMQRAAFAERHPDKIPLRGVRCFLDRVRNLTRLTVAKAYASFLVANNYQRSETEAPAPLYDLGDTIDVNELIHKLAVAIIAVPLSTSAMWFSSHEHILSFFSSPSLSNL
jgi:hypothetical protein